MAALKTFLHWLIKKRGENNSKGKGEQNNSNNIKQDQRKKK